MRNTGDQEGYDRTMANLSDPEGVAAVMPFSLPTTPTTSAAASRPYEADVRIHGQGYLLRPATIVSIGGQRTVFSSGGTEPYRI